LGLKDHGRECGHAPPSRGSKTKRPSRSRHQSQP
jgi:hypothetical protein